VAPGETATVTATVSFTSDTASESLVLSVDDGSAATTTQVTENAWGITTDSANVASAAASGWRVNTTVGSTTGTGDIGIVSTSGTAKVVTAKTTLAFVVLSTATAPAVYTYTVALKNASGTLLSAATYSLTITARDTTAVATKSKFWLNGAAFTTSAIEADSAIATSAGAAAVGGAPSYTAVGFIQADLRNAADTNTVTGSTVTGNLVLVVTGPGVLEVSSSVPTSSACTAGVKSITMTATNKYAKLCSDGNAGTATLTGYIGSTALTQAAKTVTFVGKAVTLTATANDITASGANLSSDAADSITVGTNIVTFTAKDSAGNAVTSASQNRNGAFYCISSDTSVVGASTTGAPTDTLSYVAAVYVAATGWECDMTVRGKGTATVTVADSMTVASSAYTSSAITIKTETKTGYTGTISFDKTSYNLGDMAIITVTSKAKTTGNNVGMSSLSGNASNPFTGIVQNRPFSNVKSGAGFGGGSGLTWDLSSSTFVNGVETYVVYMPTTSGKVTLTGFTSYESTTSNTAVSVSVDVVDPLEAVVKTTVADAQAAADAATDAALQAIDAANAATDAANLAAEAADAATVAAEEAKDAADAATAAVEGLATQVATLMAALQAQIRSLANTVAKIAKKVKA